MSSDEPPRLPSLGGQEQQGTEEQEQRFPGGAAQYAVLFSGRAVQVERARVPVHHGIRRERAQILSSVWSCTAGFYRRGKYIGVGRGGLKQ